MTGSASASVPTFVVHPDPTLRFVVVNTALQTGSRHDPPGKSGLAHVVEHVMCESAGETPQAGTTFERTDYLETGPPGALADLLDRAAERLRRGADGLTEEALERHRRIVLEEINQREVPARFGSGLRRSLRLLFGPGHPFGKPPLGVPAEVESVTVADVAEFIGRRYAAARVVVSVVGTTEADAALKLAGDRFGGVVSEVDDPVPSARRGRRREDVEEGQPTGMLRYAFALPAEGTVADHEAGGFRGGSGAPANTAAGVAMAVLAGAPWALLGADFAREHRLIGVTAQHVKCVSGSSLGLLKLSVPAGVDLDEIDAAVGDRLAALGRNGPPEEVLTAAKALRAKEYLAVVSTSRTLAAELCDRELRRADRAEADDPLGAIRSVRSQDVAGVAARCFGESAVVAFHAADRREASWIH